MCDGLHELENHWCFRPSIINLPLLRTTTRNIRKPFSAWQGFIPRDSMGVVGFLLISLIGCILCFGSCIYKRHGCTGMRSTAHVLSPCQGFSPFKCLILLSPRYLEPRSNLFRIGTRWPPGARMALVLCRSASPRQLCWPMKKVCVRVGTRVWGGKRRSRPCIGAFSARRKALAAGVIDTHTSSISDRQAHCTYPSGCSRRESMLLYFATFEK